MLDLLLINPGGRSSTYQGLGASLAAVEPPLWCRLIAGYCKGQGYSVAILDAQALDLDAKAVAVEVEELGPRLVAMVAYGHQPSGSTQQMAPAIEACRAIKELSGHFIIIVGGHVAALTEETMREESIDYACSGEGPETIERLLDGDDIKAIPGLAWRTWGSVTVNPPGPVVKSLELLPGDMWHELPMDKYRAHNWQCFDGSPRAPYASIHTSLGCPFTCSFCCINAPFGGSSYRMRFPGAVVAEVNMLYEEYGVRTFKIIDEMFILRPSHYLPICEGLAKLPFAGELNFWAYARIDTVKIETLPLLRRAGIRWLCLGIESGAKSVRDKARKSIDDTNITEVVRAIQAAGISVIGNFMFGLPSDTLETMRDTLDLAKSLNCEFVNFYSAMAYPGSELHAKTDPEDLPAEWTGYSQHSFDSTPLPTATLSSDDVLRFRDSAFHEYFENPAYLDMLGEKFGAFAVAEVEAMTSVILPRQGRPHA